MGTINEFIAKYGIDKLNSMTKYPSILTYHTLGEKGMLLEELNEGFSFDGECYITEKIDGTNTRIVFDHMGDYLIGSREDFLFAKGDRIGNPAMGIIDAVKSIANRIQPRENEGLTVIFGESYGGNITQSSKQYTSDRSVGFRIFDVMQIGVNECDAVLAKNLDQISSWREHGGQIFKPVDFIRAFAMSISVSTVPYITVESNLPTTREEILDWLMSFENTRAGINFTGRAEGVVVRTADRSGIRKIRFEDYERTKKRGGF